MLAAGLIQGGISWGQALLTILLGNLLVLVPIVLIAHASTRFGIKALAALVAGVAVAWSASPCRRSARSTTTPGSSASPWPSGSTRS